MKSVIIVGGSMGGLLIGNILLRAGWDVRVFERTEGSLQSRGAGIATQRALIAALGRAGVTVQPEMGIAFDRRIHYDRSGAVVGTHAYSQYTTSWGGIYGLLRGAFPDERYHSGRSVLSVEQDGDQARVVFADGETASADLVVGSDGIRSTVRAQLFPDSNPCYAGYVAWRGMLEEHEVPETFRETAFSSFSFGFCPGEEVVGYPVAGADGSTEPGRRRFNVMWYRPAEPDTALKDLLTGTNGTFYPQGIPPGLIRPELVEQVKADADRLLPPIFAQTLARMEGLFFQPIYDLKSDRIAAGRVVLAGDAAFVARPHCGAGVSKAASDALALADALAAARTVPDATERYGRERTKAGREAVEWAAHLGSYFQMDANGLRRADYAPDRPPVSMDFIVRNTGIELSEAGVARGT